MTGFFQPLVDMERPLVSLEQCVATADKVQASSRAFVPAGAGKQKGGVSRLGDQRSGRNDAAAIACA